MTASSLLTQPEGIWENILRESRLERYSNSQPQQLESYLFLNHGAWTWLSFMIFSSEKKSVAYNYLQ